MSDVAHRLEEVILVAVQLEVGATGEPERLVREDVHAREEGVEMRADHLLEWHEAVPAGQCREPRQRGRDLDPRHALIAGYRVGHDHRQVERHRRDVWEGMRGIDRQRGQHREDLLREVRVEEARSA